MAKDSVSERRSYNLDLKMASKDSDIHASDEYLFIEIHKNEFVS